MTETNPYGGSRLAGYLIFLASLATVIIAVINTPLGEWQGWSYFLGALLVVFGLAFLFSAVKNRMNIVGRNTRGKTNLIISVVGLIATIIAVISNFVTQGEAGWTVSSILTTGLFAALAVMFAAGIPASRAKMAAGL
jgi:hypothetical protein